jgi:hypothetical protein
VRWFLHGEAGVEVREALARHGHQCMELPESAGLSSDQLIALLHRRQLDLLTTDEALVGRLFEVPVRYDRSVVLIQAGTGAIEQTDAVERLFERYKRLTPGRLYTISPGRVKVRQLPKPAAGGGKARSNDVR